MRMALAVLLNSLLILSVPTPQLAKGKTVKVTITGADLKTPIEISDSKILTEFQVWTGPGTSSSPPGFNANAPGFIIDWSPGAVAAIPQAHRRYQVSFYTDVQPNGQPAYVVFYAFVPGSEQGYVYLPGKSDERWALNVRTIFRGVEGQWFHAWSAWERVARPLIEKAELRDSVERR